MTERPSEIKGVDDLVTLLEALAEEEEARGGEVTVADVVDGFGDAAFLPLIMVLALVVVSPLSGIFFLPTILGLVIAVLSIQMFFGKRHLWLPGFILRRKLAADRVERAAERLHGLARWLDSHSKRRFRVLVQLPLRGFLPLVIATCALSMPLLELVPFSSSLLGMAITLICTGLLLKDGLWVGAALVFIGSAAMIPIWLFF